MPDNKKYYSNMDGCIALAQGKDGQTTTYSRVELEARVATSPDVRTANTRNGQRKVVSLRVPIENRAALIERLTGAKPEVDDKGTVWATISIWNGEKFAAADMAERAVMEYGYKYIHVNGAITARKYTDRNQHERVSIEIQAYSAYFYNRAGKNGSGAPANSNGGTQPYKAAPAPAVPPSSNFGSDPGAFEDLDDADFDAAFGDDLPF